MRSEDEIRKRLEYWKNLLREKKFQSELGDISRRTFAEYCKQITPLVIELNWVLQEDNQ